MSTHTERKVRNKYRETSVNCSVIIFDFLCAESSGEMKDIESIYFACYINSGLQLKIGHVRKNKSDFLLVIRQMTLIHQYL